METSASPATATAGGEKAMMGFLSYANGGLKRHYPTAPEEVSYKECMKNHAASMGGHALDGCCEFMASPATFNPDDPTSLRCAACGCHRNFHRRDPDDPAPLHRHPVASTGGMLGKKRRFRSKFSEEQKEKMQGFSERFGWKMQKIQRNVVHDFCNEVGVPREVLKVWMHNHKNTTTAQNAAADVLPSSGDGDGDGSSSSSSSGFSI